MKFKGYFAAPFFAAALIGLALASCGNPPDTGTGGNAPAGEGLYHPPAVIPGANGDVIWQRPVTISGVAANAWKILYHSTNATGRAIGVSGIVLVPTAPFTGPRPLVAMGPETAGLTDDCAPSKYIANNNYIELDQIKQVLAKGWAIAVTDYEGLGTPGRHTYMVKDAQAHAVLDVARAATRLPGTGLSATTPVGLWGYSQGGGAAAAAAEAAPTYAPDVQVKGTAAGGVPADLIAVSNALQGGFFGFVLAAAQGFDAAYPELRLNTFLNQAGKDLLQQVDTNAVSECLFPLVTNFTGKHTADYTTTDPLATTAWQARLNQSKLGMTKPTQPIFVYHSIGDEIIPNAVGVALKDRYCALGATVSFNGFYLLEHLSSEGAAMPDVINFLSDRFAGNPAPTTC
jgi:Secretory lipase